MLTKEAMFGMYIGQKIHNTVCKDTIERTLTEVARDHVHYRLTAENVLQSTIHLKCNIDKCKLILRPFESMTDEELTVNDNLKADMYEFTREDVACQIEYLISIGIDVFNLKERGWAVYESEVGK